MLILYLQFQFSYCLGVFVYKLVDKFPTYGVFLKTLTFQVDIQALAHASLNIMVRIEPPLPFDHPGRLAT
jgi:hypothetical protein